MVIRERYPATRPKRNFQPIYNNETVSFPTKRSDYIPIEYILYIEYIPPSAPPSKKSNDVSSVVKHFRQPVIACEDSDPLMLSNTFSLTGPRPCWDREYLWCYYIYPSTYNSTVLGVSLLVSFDTSLFMDPFELDQLGTNSFNTSQHSQRSAQLVLSLRKAFKTALLYEFMRISCFRLF